MHLCWGNYEGPHHCDVPLADVIDIVLRARPSALSLEAANPRHAHEWKLFETVKLPDGKLLIPGVIESKSNFIEHPELVAQRIGRYAQAGRPRKRHRRQRLRLRHLGRPGGGRPRRGVGQDGRDGRGRAHRDARILEAVKRSLLGSRFRRRHCCPGTGSSLNLEARSRAGPCVRPSRQLLNALCLEATWHGRVPIPHPRRWTG